MMYYVIDDEKISVREAFVASEEEKESCFENYSGYVIVRVFDMESAATDYCNKYNAYELETDKPVCVTCCYRECTMSAWEYGHWNGKCAYEGQYYEGEDEIEEDDEF